MECNLIFPPSSSCPITKKTIRCSDTNYNFLEALAKASKGQHTGKNSHPRMATPFSPLPAHLATSSHTQTLSRLDSKGGFRSQVLKLSFAAAIGYYWVSPKWLIVYCSHLLLLSLVKEMNELHIKGPRCGET